MNRIGVIFAGGGTGGHLSPAMAIADKLKSRLTSEYAPDILFIGTKRGIEYRMREKLGYPLALINIRGMMRTWTLSNLAVPFLLIGAVTRSLSLMKRFNPAIVVGTGGYVMGPVMIAAILLGRRRVIQEQNSYPGVTTRQLAGRVDRIFLGFGEAKKYLKRTDHCVETGNPVKEIIGKVPRSEGRAYFEISNEERVILILGGSQGASAINKNILRGLSTLPDGFSLIWQTGERDYKEVAALAGGKVTSRSLFAFTDRIEMAYAAADIVVARAGALTLAEITAAGLPSLLIPYPFAAGNHQRKNAAVFAEKGAAVLFDDRQLGSISLLDEAVTLLMSGQAEQMKEAVREIDSHRTKPAADMIADEILRLLNLGRKAT
ncbi:UDP-N-acetylglucosamine--N-acetylmuramyl-(pentapeptide) pyrophosphoryl-undecaprenol N-acetylglucosamine transferase [Candidatus Zixiibacteriota bacterium]|nr:UDP-N-acetylglucosamine--N-acetylmuramyl-(pentapeptide) pyrophosphoryl-undecaprenol N-acetylglucosamine transferase [candidate division Zixibacteria bacterium]